MRLLLDTHALIWIVADAKRVSAEVGALVHDPATTVFVSAATGWEIATKVRLGKLRFDPAFLSDFENRIRALAFTSLAVTATHAVAAGARVYDHRDPFDRLIAAQAVAEGLTVATVDRAIADLGASVVW